MHSALPKTLYIFIDESGNFDFSPSGTKYFALTSITTMQPLKNRSTFFNLRYTLLREGMNQECFHATEDKQKVRDQIFSYISKLDDIQVDCVLVQKNKANPSLYLEVSAKNKNSLAKTKVKHSGERLYKVVSQSLLKYIFRNHKSLQEADRIVVILGQIFVSNKREFILKSLKKFLKEKTNKPFYIYFHKSEADINCQLADYCGWAIFVNAERKESRPLKNAQDKINSCIDIFAIGTMTYYDYKK